MIISASRRTDIPAFYSDWFIRRLEEGFLYVRNPFNAHQISKINLSPEIIECVVFWSKNPLKLLNQIDKIDDLGYKYYFQFTITSYDSTIEKNVPRKKEIIDTFIKLSKKIGKHKVIWRYDPIFFTDKFDIEYHIKWYEFIAKAVHPYTDKCVISFIDMYQKCKRHLKSINVEEVVGYRKKKIAKTFAEIASSYSLALETCAEEIDLNDFGIKHGKCIDNILISQIINSNIIIGKDKSQRNECGCVESIDIGAYNTCHHGCKYCYANFSQKAVERNSAAHHKLSPLLIGEITGKEKVTERRITSLVKSRQRSLF